MKPILVFRHVAHEGLGYLEEIFDRAGLVYRYAHLYQEPSVTFDPSQLAGLVVLGGPMNVDETDRYPFLAREVEWIRQAVAVRLPILGICLGAQLLAKALGAKVYPNGIKEIGWYSVELTEEGKADNLIQVFRPIETVFQWHGDTFDLPQGAVLLAKSEQCRQQAFRYGENAYGFQFHAEMTQSMVESWLDHPQGQCEVGGLSYINETEIRRRTPEKIQELNLLADRVFGRFADLCRRRA